MNCWTLGKIDDGIYFVKRGKAGIILDVEDGKVTAMSAPFDLENPESISEFLKHTEFFSVPPSDLDDFVGDLP